MCIRDRFGLSIKEVSEILDITPKAVKGLLYRARLNLESFFQGHCSFLDINNPCTCKEWIEFMNTRNSIQKKMRQSLTVLNYKQNGYVQNTKTTQMILHYYHNIPDQRPSQISTWDVSDKKVAQVYKLAYRYIAEKSVDR